VKRTLGLLGAALALSCGGAQLDERRGSDAAVHVTGHVRYGARHEGTIGLTATEEWRAARFVEVRLIDRAGAIVATGSTDADGVFALDGEGPVELEITARATHDGLDVSTTRDSGGREVHTLRQPLALADGAHEASVELTISDAETEMAGALHITETLLFGLERVHEWTGETLPTVFVYWGRGVTTDWSYYRGEMPSGSGRFCLELLGGQPGQQASTDTDEHDEAIQLHELGHFVMDRLSGDSSIGGMHPRGVLVDPGVAWEEGRATWFATAVLGLPFYRDTIGIAPTGSTRVDENLETPQPPRGLGSETSAAGILWDLADGGDAPGALLDGDDDGVALGPAAVLAAMIAQAREPGSFASIGSFLRFLVRTHVVSAVDVLAMLAATGEPASLLPLDDVSLWPVDVAVGSTVRGLVDGVTDPAPSGGGARPDNGFDAIRAFRVHVPARGMLDVQLVIDGSGTAADRTDLDLELRDIRAHVLDRTSGATPRQAVVDLVEAGDYVVYVRDAGTGNRAEFDVRVAFTPVAQ
jgi:hypothetical protein